MAWKRTNRLLSLLASVSPIIPAIGRQRHSWSGLHLLRFLRTLQLSTHEAILRTVAGLNAQSTIGPELPFAAKPVRRLHQCNQAGCPNRTDAGDLAQQFRGFMFPTLR